MQAFSIKKSTKPTRRLNNVEKPGQFMNVYKNGFKAFTILLVALAVSSCGLFKSKKEKQDIVIPDPIPVASQTASVQRIWKRKIGDFEKSFARLVPALGPDRLLVTSPNGRVQAIDRKTGDQIWQVKLKQDINAGVGYGGGIAALVTEDGELIALSTEDGSEKWRSSLRAEVLARPVIGNAVVVAQAVDGQVMGLSVTSGSREWSYRQTVPSLTLHGTAEPLVVSYYAVAGFSNGRLAAIELASGRVVWELPVGQASGQNEIDRLIDIDARPVIDGDTMYVAVYQGNLTAIEVRSGQIIWSKDISTHKDFSVDSNRLYVIDDKERLLAINRASGEVEWTADWLSHRAPTGTVTTNAFVAVADASGFLYLIDKESGEAAAQVRVAKDGVQDTPIWDDDTLYVQGRNGVLNAYQIQDQ